SWSTASVTRRPSGSASPPPWPGAVSPPAPSAYRATAWRSPSIARPRPPGGGRRSRTPWPSCAGRTPASSSSLTRWAAPSRSTPARGAAAAAAPPGPGGRRGAGGRVLRPPLIAGPPRRSPLLPPRTWYHLLDRLLVFTDRIGMVHPPDLRDAGARVLTREDRF